MRPVAQFFLKIEGKEGAFRALHYAAQAEGWTVTDTDTNGEVVVSRLRSDITPLDLGLFQYADEEDLFQVFFGQSWFRCVLAGGWARPGHLPKDILGRIIKRLLQGGWRVSIEDGLAWREVTD